MSTATGGGHSMWVNDWMEKLLDMSANRRFSGELLFLYFPSANRNCTFCSLNKAANVNRALMVGLIDNIKCGFWFIFFFNIENSSCWQCWLIKSPIVYGEFYKTPSYFCRLTLLDLCVQATINTVRHTALSVVQSMWMMIYCSSYKCVCVCVCVEGISTVDIVSHGARAALGPFLYR